MACVLGVGHPRQGGTQVSSPRRYVSWPWIDSKLKSEMFPWRGSPPPRKHPNGHAKEICFLGVGYILTSQVLILSWRASPRQGGIQCTTPRGFRRTISLDPIGLRLRLVKHILLNFSFIFHDFPLRFSRSFQSR